MGKDYWWYWPAPAFGRSSSSSTSTSTSTSSSKASTSSGCMCSLFQTFHFHPFHFSINQHQHKSPSSISQCLSKDGAEGPRNSLESQHGTASSKEQQHLQIPKNIRIKTSRSMTRTRSGNYSSDFSSEMSFSPGTKTPTLVARLMGLDLLPENNSSSPNSSSSSTLSTPIISNKHGRSNNNNNNPQVHHHNPKARHQHHHIQIMRHRHSTDSIGTIRSLSDTPRRSDVEHSRLSLQINKENIGVDENYLEAPRFSFSKRKFDENNNNSSSSRSPSHYARQIVKQVKESVNRRVGITEITNTVKNREQESSVVQQIRFKKATKTSSNVNVNVIVNEACSPGKQSPRLSRFVDSKQNNPNSITKPSSPLTPKDQKPLSSSPTTTPLPIAHQTETQLSSKDDLQSKKSSSAPKCKRSRTTEKLGSGVNRTTAPQTSSIRKKQQESFVSCTLSPTRSKTKNRSTHPLSSNLLLNTAPNLLPVKTHPSPLPTKIPQKQPCDTQEQRRSSAQLSSCARQKYKKDAIQTPAGATTTAADDQGPEFEYITSILSRTGLRKATLPQIQYQWFSLSHPLDPSLFHNLEHHYPSSNPDKGCIFTQRDQLGLRCNRRLLFDLVDELLSEILARRKHEGGLLVETVWRKVRSFPGAKCEVLEDIDGLIEMEEMERKVKEEREEGLVMEIGRSIMETLVHETVTVFML